jgi:hypothetical protein
VLTTAGRLLGGATHIDAISGVAAIKVQTTGQPGEIVVTATSAGLESGSARIRTRKDLAELALQTS